MKKKIISLFMVSILTVASLSGCASKPATTETETTGITETTETSDASNDTSETAEAAEDTSTEVQTVRVVTASSYAPFCYLNENDELDGYDVDVCKAIDEIADDLEFTYEWCDWASMLPGLDAGRYDLCVYQLGKNADREAMYHYGEIPYSNAAGAAIITTDEHPDWTSFDDIAATGDAKIGCIVGSSFTEYVEQYLNEHPGAYEISYYDVEIDAVLADIVNGRIDATINDGSVALEKAKVNGTDEFLKVTGYVTDPNPVWFLYPQTEYGEEISAKIDEYIKQVYESGKLNEIAVKWLGDDYVVTTLADTEYFK